MSEVSGNEVTAYSPDSGKHYLTWDALVEAEANGHVAVAVLDNGKESWPWVEGPFATKREANNARVRLRTKFKREVSRGDIDPDTTAKFFVRPLWKPDR